MHGKYFSVLKFHCVNTYLLFLTATCTCTEIQRVGNKVVLKAISVTCMVVHYFQKSALNKEHPHWKSTFRPLTSCWQQNTLHYTSHQHWSKCLPQENVSSMDSNDHVVLFSKPMQVHVFQNCFTLQAVEFRILPVSVLETIWCRKLWSFHHAMLDMDAWVRVSIHWWSVNISERRLSHA